MNRTEGVKQISNYNKLIILQQISTGVAISSNCMKIQFLFQRHNFNFTDLRNLEQKVVTFSFDVSTKIVFVSN